MNQMNMRSGGCAQQRQCGMNPARMNQLMEQCEQDPAQNCGGDPVYGMPLAMGYVPFQKWGQTYTPAEGLSYGTIFPVLNLPFLGCVPRSVYARRGGRA